MTCCRSGRSAMPGRKRASRVPMVRRRLNGVLLSVAQTRRLSEAERLMRGGHADQRRARAILRELEREAVAVVEAVAADRAVDRQLARMRSAGLEVTDREVVEAAFAVDADTGAMKRERGELVLVSRRSRRAGRVDGLLSAHKAGIISDDELRTGEAFRVIVTLAEPRVASCLGTEPGRGGAEVGAQQLTALKRAYAGARLRTVQASMAAEDWRVLLAVAGHGMTIRAVRTSHGSASIKTQENLKAGLRVARSIIWPGSK